MDQPPRRQGKRLVGKLLLWRMFFVCHVVVCLVLGMFAWARNTGHSLGQSRAEAFNVLVGAQVGGAFGHSLCATVSANMLLQHVCLLDFKPAKCTCSCVGADLGVRRLV
jgi:hypothetical protein